MDGPFLHDTVSSCRDAAAIGQWLIAKHPTGRFAFAGEARIAYLLQQPALMLHGEAADAYITRASVQGANRLLFDFLTAQRFSATLDPFDFLIYFDAAAWADRAARNPERGVSGYPILQEALVFHELCHLRQLETSDGEPRYHDDGRAMLALTRHDHERFADEITAYGPVTLEIDGLARDIVAGAAAEKDRRKLRRVG